MNIKGAVLARTPTKLEHNAIHNDGRSFQVEKKVKLIGLLANRRSIKLE